MLRRADEFLPVAEPSALNDALASARQYGFLFGAERQLPGTTRMAARRALKIRRA
ncbi:MAG: hypothetical protein KIS78_17075 [Labilithrix sp.]|nr:hypothetical protein [Labilithrix sp.]